MDVFITLRHLSKTYNSHAGPVVALSGIDLAVERGELLMVTGKSGSGKTTLVNVLTGLDSVSGGEVWVGEVPVHALSAERVARWRGLNVGVVFQSFELLPGLTVAQNVMLPMDFAGKYTPRERQRRALHLLDQMGIADHAAKRPAALSGGQQQRVAIARAMANDPVLLVADEPTGSLDSATAQVVAEVFKALTGTGKTIVFVTHDNDLAAYGSRNVQLSDGCLLTELSRSIDEEGL